mgnify:CR=1 FL=1
MALKSFASAAGFLTALSAPALLALGAWLDKPALAGGTILLLFPLARLMFGAFHSSMEHEWHPRVARLLDQLPHAYVVVLAAALTMVLWKLHAQSLTVATAAQWILSLWVVLMLATCVAHELLHRKSRAERFLGHALTGIAGYPVLGYEHVRHHRLRGSTGAAEWPRLSDSVWAFGGRRLRRIAAETVGPRGMAWLGNSASPTVRGVRIGLTACVLAWAAFSAAAGWGGGAVYALTAVFVAGGVQLVTYMQHWGLGDDHLPDARSRELAWEDDCRFEAWLTMSMSVHQTHHVDAGRPFYSLAPTPGSPRMPTGYVLLMVAALIPPVWRRTMTPALEYWLAHPEASPSAGRHVLCVAAYRRS